MEINNYSYDPAGNLATRTDALGRTTHYAYNTYNLVTQVQYPTNPAVTFAYDVLGRRTQMTDGTGTTTWTWNAASQNIGASQSAIGQGLTYSYDAENHRTGMAVGSWTTGYTYDAAGRLQTLTDSRVSATTPFSYAYQAQTNWVAGHSNADGSASINQYDVLGRLVQISAATGAGAGLNTYGYSYDAAGQRTQEASTVGTRDFAYDNQRQLTSAYRVDSSGQPLANYNYSFAYDPIGNWKSESANGPTGLTTTTFTANALNQYTAILPSAGVAKPQNPSYDLNGNMTSDGKGNSFVYDEENRLIEADTPGAASLAKVISVYDGLSRRVEKRGYDSSGNLLSTTRYLYDGLLPIAECDANNVIQRTYTRGLDLSGTMQGAGGIGGLLALTDGTGSYSYFCDGNGNVVDLTNAYGINVSHQEYDPFGNIVNFSGTFQQPYQWSSKENDGNGLVYYLYRFYNPAIGRWQNRDPIQELGTLSNLENIRIQVESNLINLENESIEANQSVRLRQLIIELSKILIVQERALVITDDVESILDLMDQEGGENFYALNDNDSINFVDTDGYGKQSARNKDRDGHKGKKNSDKHGNAQGHGGRQKDPSRFTPKPKRNNFSITCYCTQHPGICIGAGLLVIGGGVALGVASGGLAVPAEVAAAAAALGEALGGGELGGGLVLAF